MRTAAYEACKRALDITLGLAALTSSLPAQAFVAAAIALREGRPILFRQVRPGRGGRPFVLYKFRTMRPLVPSRGWTDDASRLTDLGQFLRSTSLDELPTLWNVVRGDMSLVGPRPLLMQYLGRYTPEQSRRHEVRPGLTGLAQVSGRNAISWTERLALDVAYVDRRSLRLDAHLLMRTMGMVLRRTGIHALGSATMPEFTGTRCTPRADS